MKLKYKKSYRFKDLPEKTRNELTDVARQELCQYALDTMGVEIITAMLYVMNEDYGFGKQRLRKLYDRMFETQLELKEAWAGSDKDLPEFYRRELYKVGVDIDFWIKSGRAWNDGEYKNDERWNAFGQKEWRGRKK